MRQSKFSQKCVACGWHTDDLDYTIYCNNCGKDALLISQYHKNCAGNIYGDVFSDYLDVLPYKNILQIPGPRLATVFSERLGEKIGVKKLWVIISGYAPEYGAEFVSGTFKECEAVGVLSRVKEETDKVLILSSAGNAGRAVIDIASEYSLPAIVVMPDDSFHEIAFKGGSLDSSLLILLKGAHYNDAIRMVDNVVSMFPDYVVREGGCYNIARRDSMAIPFAHAIEKIGGVPDIYVQAVGSGTGAIAASEYSERIQARRQCEKKMKLLLVQNSLFNPMVNAWRNGRRFIDQSYVKEAARNLSKVATKVLSNENPPYGVAGGVFDWLTKVQGDMCTVSNEEIYRSKSLINDSMGLNVSAESAAALAGLIQKIEFGDIDRNKTVLVHFTGVGVDDVFKDYEKSICNNISTHSVEDVDGVKGVIAAYLKEYGVLPS